MLTSGDLLRSTTPHQPESPHGTLSNIPSHLPDPAAQPPVPYVVYVSTANARWAGTDKDVFMQLVGDLYTTDYIYLREGGAENVQSSLRYTAPDNCNTDATSRFFFAKSSIRQFRFKAQPLGNIVKICIRHDPTEDTSAAWKMERVVIHRDDHLQRSWSFLCSRWLTHEMGNFVELKPSGEVSAGRRASRRASRRLSTGKLIRPPDGSESTVGPNYFESMRDRFGNDSQDGVEVVSGGPEAGTRRVCFQLQKFTSKGCHVYLLGAIPALGGWQPQHALRMIMQSAADGTWRGEWRLEVEIDDDSDDIQYTYMIVHEDDAKSNRRVDRPDRLRRFKLSAPDSLGRTTEGGRIHIRDSFGANKFGLPSASSPNLAMPQPLRQDPARTPSNGSSPILEYSLTKKSDSVEPASPRLEKVPRSLSNNLDNASNEHALHSESCVADDPALQSDRNSEESEAAGMFETEGRGAEDISDRVEQQRSIAGGMATSPKDEIQRDEEAIRREWKEQLDASDGQLYKSAHQLLQRQSEVQYLKERNIINVSGGHHLSSPLLVSPDETSPVSSDATGGGDRYLNMQGESDVIDLTCSDSKRASTEEIRKLQTEVERLERERDANTASTAAVSNELRSSLQEMHSEMSDQCEQFSAQQAELVRLVMDVQESHRTVRERLILEKEDLHQRWAKEFKSRRKLFNTIQELRGNIRVFCRVRPPKLLAPTDGVAASLAVDFPDATDDESAKIQIGTKAFEFDHVFQPSSTQAAVYDETAGVVGSVLDGYNVCVFAYGQTGSGKTHTMNGPEDDRGVNYRALVDLFDIASQRSEFSSITISVSMMEIYNENLRDLIRPDDGAVAPKLDIRKDQSSGSSNAVYVSNLTEIEVDSVDSVWDVMERGGANRKKGKTNMNEHSSRSHLILKVKATCEEYVSGLKSSGCLHLVDLAGSERVGRSNVSGERLKEAQHINKSLATLGDVFMALLSSSSHVPYRNSKLTYLLQDSLGGDSKTLMFVNVSADYADSSETVSSLQFAQRVAKVELGTAKKHTEKTMEAKAVAALEAKEVALKDITSKVSDLQRELKKRSAEAEVASRHAKALEKELSSSKIRYEEQHRRAVSGLQGSAEEAKELRALHERSQGELKAAKQKVRDVMMSKDEEISRLTALLKAKDDRIAQLSRTSLEPVDKNGTPVLSRLVRPASTPNVTSKRFDRPTVPRIPRAATTFSARSRQVRFESPTHDTVGEVANKKDSSSDGPSAVPSTPANGPRRVGESGLERSQTMSSLRASRQPSKAAPPVTGKPISFAFGKRVSSNPPDSGTAVRPTRSARLPRSQSTVSRPAQRVSQVNSRTRQAVGQSNSRSFTAARRAGTTASIQRAPKDREGLK